MTPEKLGPYCFALTNEEREIHRKRALQRWRSSGLATLGWWPMVIALALILAFWLFLAIGGFINPATSQLALMFGVASFFVGKWLHQWEIERAYARVDAELRALDAASHAEMSIAVGETQVAVEGRYDWSQFVDCEDHADLVWLWMSRNQAAIIPARAFPDPEQRAALQAFLRARINPRKL
jgi:hypothetical protein